MFTAPSFFRTSGLYLPNRFNFGGDMMMEYGLTPEDTIKLIDMENEENNPYVSNVMRVTTSGAVYVTNPKLNSRHHGLVKGKKYLVRFKAAGEVMHVWATYSHTTQFRNRTVLVIKTMGTPSRAYEREHIRVTHNEIVDMFALDYGDLNEIPKVQGRMVNISKGGARVLSGARLKVGNLVVLDITLGHNTLHGITAEVVNITRKNMENSIGLKFRDVTDDELKALADYIGAGGTTIGQLPGKKTADSEDEPEEYFEYFVH